MQGISNDSQGDNDDSMMQDSEDFEEDIEASLRDLRIQRLSDSD